MDRKAVRSWVMYDWANSAFATTMLAAVLPIYYESVAGSGLDGNLPEVYWGYTQTIAMIIVAVLSPIMGAIADHTGAKVKFLAAFAVLGAVASASTAFVGSGDWLLASVLIVFNTFGGWLIALMMGSRSSVVVLWPQLALSILAYPVIARLIVLLDRWRLTR